MTFLNLQQVFSSKIGQSTDFLSVLPKKLTLSGYITDQFRENHKTLFKEVDFLPPIATKEEQDVFNAEVENKDLVSIWGRVNKLNMPYIDKVKEHQRQAKMFENWTPQKEEDKLFNDYHNRLLKVIEDAWEPKMTHLVYHSSGYDTRTISLIIKELKEKNGPKWLGKVIFACDAVEKASFIKVMKAEGWKDYYIVNDVPRNQHYGVALKNFKDAWKQSNGVIPYPFNILYETAQELKRRKIIGKEFQSFTGLWGNEVISQAASERFINGHFEQYYRYLMSNWKIPGKIVKPFLDLELIRILNASPIKNTHFRYWFLEKLNPKIAKLRNDDNLKKKIRKIDPSIIAKAQKDYDASWYGKSHPIKLPKVTEYNIKWSHWTAASLCEYLLNNGYKIKK